MITLSLDLGDGWELCRDRLDAPWRLCQAHEPDINVAIVEDGALVVYPAPGESRVPLPPDKIVELLRHSGALPAAAADAAKLLADSEATGAFLLVARAPGSLSVRQYGLNDRDARAALELALGTLGPGTNLVEVDFRRRDR